MRLLSRRTGESLRAARFTGYQIDGGYAEYTVADERFCFAIPTAIATIDAAPLLCAGLIGYRALRMAGEARAAGPVWLRRGGAHHRPGRALAGPARSTPSPAPARRERRNSPASWARCGPAARTSRRRSRWTPRSSSRRSARWCRPRCVPSRRAARSSARGIHMSDDPRFSLRDPVERAGRALGRQPDARGMARNSWRSRRRCR